MGNTLLQPQSNPLIRGTVGNPAAGADFILTVPAGASWLIQSVRAQLVTSAAVANRVASFIYDDGANEFSRSGGIIAQPASTTEQYIAAPGFPVMTGAFAGGTVYNLPMQPGLLLPPGARIRSNTALIDVADQWSAIVVTYLEA